jgi:mannitol/fructose-specific phosphotransferase system IIA component (Ntr-type)
MSHNVNVMALVQLIKGGNVQKAVDVLHGVAVSNNSATEPMLMVAQLSEMLEGSEMRQMISALATYKSTSKSAIGLLHLVESPVAVLA